MCVHARVCVCERERERERGGAHSEVEMGQLSGPPCSLQSIVIQILFVDV